MSKEFWHKHNERKAWFESRTPKELEEIEQWMIERVKLSKENEELKKQLEEAREEVEYAINFFNKNQQFGVVGILKEFKNKLKEKG
jgi:hypothetical protein